MKDQMILQCSPKASYTKYKKEIDEATLNVLDSGWYILGEEVTQFEKEFANYLGSGYCISVANGTEALSLAMIALGIGKGDAVITVSHTAVATVAAINMVGATAVLTDIDLTTYNIDINELTKTIAHCSANRINVKAIIPVHLYGNPADIMKICEIASKHDLYVIEDCAQAHGAKLNNQMAGTFGHAAAFSFYPTKNLGAFGDGGAVVTNDEDLHKKLMSLRQYGWVNKFDSELPGINSRLDELQAAILRVKLKYLNHDNFSRQQAAAFYMNNIDPDYYKLPSKTDNTVEHVYHQFVIQNEKRDELQMFLNKNNIQTSIHYPLAVHSQIGYSKSVLVPFPLKNTENIISKILSLPMYPELPADELNYVTNKLSEFKTR